MKTITDASRPCPRLPMAPDQADDFLSAPPVALSAALGEIEGPISVLGAGGKMGLHVCAMIRRADAAAGRDRPVIAVSRFSSLLGEEPFRAWGIETRACDLTDAAALAALPPTPNLVYMAGAKFGTDGQPDLLRRMNVELPRQVARHFAGARCLVFSTGCVYALRAPTDGGSREEDATAPPGEYAQSCLERERAFRDAAEQSGSRVALIRLNYATEFRYGVLVDIAQKVLADEPVSLAMGWVNVIWQRDAVEQILRAFPLTAAPPLVLNIAGPDILPVRELAALFGAAFGRRPRFQGREGETCWLNDARRAHQLFGPPPTALEDMIAWTAAWLQTGGDTFGKPTGFERRNGKF